MDRFVQKVLQVYTFHTLDEAGCEPNALEQVQGVVVVDVVSLQQALDLIVDFGSINELEIWKDSGYSIILLC